MTPSKRFTLNELDWIKLGRDALWFFLVPLTFYIVAVLEVIQAPQHILTVSDFIPTNTTLIVIVSWFLNQMLNAARKFISGK